MGTELPLPQKGAQPPSPIFGPCLLWPNGWVDQDGTWHGGRPQPRRLCVRWRPSTPPSKGGEPPNFCPIFVLSLLIVAHFYCGQTAGCIKMPLSMDAGLSSEDFVLDGEPVPPPNKGAEPPNFRPMFIVVKWLEASGYHLVRRLASAQATLLDGDMALL